MTLSWIGEVAKLVKTGVDKLFPTAEEWKERDRIHSIKRARALRKQIRKWLEKIQRSS